MIAKVILIPLILYLIGIIFNSTIAGNAFAAIDPFNNTINLGIDSKHKNNCDENGTGVNNAFCQDITGTTTGSINMHGENNKLSADFNTNQIQECDESDDGDNNAVCSNSSINSLDSIDVFGKKNKAIIAMTTVMVIIYQNVRIFHT